MNVRRWPMVPSWFAVATVCLSMLYPVLYVVFNSFKTSAEYFADPFGVPTNPSTATLVDIWTRGGLGRAIGVSLLVTCVAVVILTVGAMTAGWAFGALRFPGRNTLKGLMIMLMLLSPTALIVPVFTVTKFLHLLNNPVGLSLVYASLHLPFAAYLIASYAQSVPRELIEAAQVDGASSVRIYRAVGLPLLTPGIMTVVTLTFLWIWNELLFGLIILQKRDMKTVQVAVATLQGRLGTPVPEIAAGMLFSMILPLVVFVLFQKNISEGLVAGSLK